MPRRLQLLGVRVRTHRASAGRRGSWLLRPPSRAALFEDCRQVSVQSLGWGRMTSHLHR